MTLLFGRSLFRAALGPDRSDRVKTLVGEGVEIFPFPANKPLPDLSKYRLVVLRYSPFVAVIDDDTSEKRQVVFEKHMARALAAGTSFCFLHHDEFVPAPSVGLPNTGYMNPDDVAKCRARQLGFSWLSRRSIAVFRRDHRDQPYCLTEPHPQFERIQHHAVSYNGFACYMTGRFDEHLATGGEVVTAFALREGKGRIIYFPFALPTEAEQIAKLVECLMSYI